jgi:hypothetical protein
MKSLIYLHLNFEPYRCACQNRRSSSLGDVHLDFEELSTREKSLSHLETLIIGGKLFNSINIYNNLFT